MKIITIPCGALILVLGGALASDALGQSKDVSAGEITKLQGGPTTSLSPKIGYVDVERVAAMSAPGKAAAAKLQELRSKKTAEAAERGKAVEALQAKMTSSQSVLNDVARARLQREFQRAQVDFQRFTEDAQAEIEATQQELLQAFNAELFPVIRKIAEDRNLWAVFSNENRPLWVHSSVDLSDDVVARLNASAAPPQKQ
jgi:Skp family chaperone for outer membrane proteins